MNLFDQYGIKEVADVTIYSIHKKEDGSGETYYMPALYLDTLKVTTTEKTAENTWAQGGLGNSRLISWDYSKEINMTLEDALCTPASLGLCWGGVLSSDWKDAQVNHQYGITDSGCGTERISRMEKCFYPRNDMANATVSSLLPRDGKEDIAEDWNGDLAYLTRSSVLDGTVVKGFGYVDSHPYKWHLEIETAVKSVAVVPDRFYSTLGKGYPIKKFQTVGINQPSESFKYEIIYRRGADNYPFEAPKAKIIYNRQAAEEGEKTLACWDQLEAISMLDDMVTYPFLKIRVCLDGSIKAYLGTESVDWDLERTIDETVADADKYWVENPYINTEQFRYIDMWERFDSINALSYYLITKYEENIYSIGPKDIKPGIPLNTYTGITYYTVPSGSYSFVIKEGQVVNIEVYDYGTDSDTMDETTANDVINKVPEDLTVTFTLTEDLNVPANSEKEAIYIAFLYAYGAVDIESVTDDSNITYYTITKNSSADNCVVDSTSEEVTYNVGVLSVQFNEIDSSSITTTGVTQTNVRAGDAHVGLGDPSNPTNGVVGLDYDLTDSNLAIDSGTCVPCCKKANLSRAIWAYVNPRTMSPYDDDYWFHQGEPYLKKSLSLSAKNSKLKAQKIVVNTGEFPGMYKIVGETYIRSRETGEDERVQLSFPLCKIKSDQTLTLEADGDPTTFNLDVEVAVPPNGVAMEITFYDVEKEMTSSCNGSRVEKDGSTRVSAQ